MNNQPTSYPDTLDLPSDRPTDYDMTNMLAYARILDVDAGRSTLDGKDWREGVRIILGRDPDADEAAAKRCWDAHLDRARWIVGDGLGHVIHTRPEAIR